MLYLLHDAAAAALLPVRTWATAASSILRAIPDPTSAAQTLCGSIFNGCTWRSGILPRIADFIQAH